jgi:alpha-beta hydrolase superfamily lysophospholipase
MEQDVLGAEYDVVRLTLENDAEGEVVATVVRRPCPGSRKAVLYIHGFVDYFFQTHLADFYVERGFNFYALDLRKYGRSLLGHQTPNFAHSMSDYFPEIDEAVRLIREDNDLLLLNGHSTGGLVSSLWADHVRGQGLIDGLFLNSPFFELNVPAGVRRTLAPVVRALAKGRPTMAFPVGVSRAYVHSIHRDHDGEWDFDLAWKPAEGFGVRAGWLAAIIKGQRQVRAGLDVDVPILAMASTTTVRGRNGDFSTGDGVLNADDIAYLSTRVGRHVTCVRIEGGLHDLVLSAPPVRAKVFDELDRWIKAYL